MVLADDVANNDFNLGAVSVAATGLVAYRTVQGTRRQLTWLDRTGTVGGTLNEPDVADLSTPRVAPDGRRVVMSRRVQGNTDLRLLEGPRASRLTFDAATEEHPVWSPDGIRIVFRLSQAGRGDLYQKLPNGAAVAERLFESAHPNKDPTDWSADGRFLLYLDFDSQTSSDLWVMPMAGDWYASGVLEDALHRASGHAVPRRPVGGVPVQRIGPRRDLRAAVPRDGLGWRSEY